MSVLPIGMSGEAGGYQIERSLRFNSADSAYLSRTPASAGNRKTWTWSGWVKRANIATGSNQVLFRAVDGVANLSIVFTTSDTILIESGVSNLFTSTPVYRDVSAWYHIVIAYDSDNATADNRLIVYVNNVSQAKASGSVSSGLELAVNTAQPHYIGAAPSDRFFNGYLTDINFIDGSALTPSSFGETDTDTGVWKPKAYTGSYGTNGFYLKFADNSGTTSTTLGKDSSGNGNNWTPNNFSVTAGAGNDSLVDTPTPYGTDTGAGGEVRGNYATLNALAKGTNVTLANGNLDYTAPNSASTFGSALSTIGMSSGKWYAEYVWTSGATNSHVGIATGNINLNTWLANNATGYSYYADGRKFNNGGGAAYGASYANGDVIGVAFDADAGTLTFYKNNVSQGTAFTGLTNGPYFFGVGMGDAGQTATYNFGQRPFAYTAPSGFKALCTQNLPTPTVVQGDDYFNTVLYTGNGNTSSHAITGVGFQPDFVWIKARSQTYEHNLLDAVRGPTKLLHSSLTNAESTTVNFNSFDSDGFNVDAEGGSSGFNQNGTTYVAWNWKANGSGVSNTAGTITSTVSANTTAGISIVTYTGNGGDGQTVGHGLGVAPKMIIVKNRTDAIDWAVWHGALPTSAGTLNTTDAFATNNFPAYAFNFPAGSSTFPTSTVFYVSASGRTFNSDRTNGNGDSIVAYCFAEVEGFSKFGSYTGNGSADGPFIYTGFRPAFVLMKVTSTTDSWVIVDNTRNPNNVADLTLFPNLSNAENSGAIGVDLLSNGFKLRTSNSNVNASQTFVFAAFAEVPFRNALAR